jgi:hypothetical protein
MADDSMEISSEHGHNDGDGDIDIDFDFTSAQVDEDYVLEDATVTTDFGQDPHPQPSPAIGNDDLMIDEDVDTYPMDDADLLHSERGDTTNQVALPFETGDSLRLGEDQNHGIQFGADDPSGTAGHLYPHEEFLDAQAVENDVAEENSGYTLQEGDPQAAEILPEPSTEQSPENLAQHESRTTSPVQGSPKSAQIPGKAPAAIHEREPTSPDNTSEQYETNANSPSQSGNSSEGVESTILNEKTFPSPQDVIVVYQTVEYALFSSSELDDPDSFFLSDMSISEKPLAELFRAVRQVIKDDLNDEDELCMAIEDLGIEAEEVSHCEQVPSHSGLTPNQQSCALLLDVTLTYILKLRENLLRNDGIESSPPLHILLGTRTSFSKRLEKLAAGAAEGKGLSQFITWEEHSESVDDSEENEENKIGTDSNLESQEQDDVVKVAQDTEAHQVAHDIDDDAPEHAAPEHEDHFDDEENLELGGSNDATLGPAESTSSSLHPATATDVNPSMPQVAQKNGSTSNEYYDEDDLIDYSEEEGENELQVQRQAKPHSNDENRTNQGIFNLFPPCLKPNTCFCSKCSLLLLAEYEAINENLRRRSLSRPVEDESLEESNNQATPATEHDHEISHVEESGIEYEEIHGHQNDFQNGGLNAAYDDFTTGQFDVTGSLEQYDGAGLSVDDFGGGGEFADDGAFGDSFDVFGADVQEYNYGEGTFENDGDDHNIQQTEAGAESNHSGAEATEDRPEQIDTTESSVTVDADEIQYEDEDEANNQSLDNTKTNVDTPAEHEDEIDYEDEAEEVDKEEEPEATTPLTTPSVLPSSNGKRSRADVEPDDAMTMRNKGTVWPPSSKRQRV